MYMYMLTVQEKVKELSLSNKQQKCQQVLRSFSFKMSWFYVHISSMGPLSDKQHTRGTHTCASCRVLMLSKRQWLSLLPYVILVLKQG